VLGSLFGSFTDALGKRFFLTTWLPSLLLVGAVLAEVAAAAGLSRVSSWVQSFPGIVQAAGVALVLLVVTLLASLVSVNITSLLRLCEGYWGNGWVHRHVGCRRRAHYQTVVAKLDTTDPGYEQIYQRFPPADLRDRVLPTRVGNILLSAEIYPYVRYGIDAVLVWPRLYQVAPDSFRNVLAAARTSMDQLVSLLACGLAFAAVGTATALVLLPWYAAPLCFAAGMALAIASYRGLVSACIPYAETVRTGFDIYRKDLLTAIGWQMAPSLEAERYQWAQIGDLWFRISPADPTALGYQPFPPHFRPPRAQDRPVPAGSAAACGGAKPMAHLWLRIGAAAAAVAVAAGVVGAARERIIHPSPFPSLAVVVAASRLRAFSTIRPSQLHVVHLGWSPFLSGLATTPKQVIGHALLSDVPTGQAVSASQVGPAVPPRTVALGATISPVANPAELVGPGDVVEVIPVCAGRPHDPPIGLSAVTVLDVRPGPATSGTPPESTTVVLAVPANVAPQAARALLGCMVALIPVS